MDKSVFLSMAKLLPMLKETVPETQNVTKENCFLQHSREILLKPIVSYMKYDYIILPAYAAWLLITFKANL